MSSWRSTRLEADLDLDIHASARLGQDDVVPFHIQIAGCDG